MAKAEDRIARVALAHAINNPLTVLVANLTFAQEELEARAVDDQTLAGVHKALTEAIGAANRIRDSVAKFAPSVGAKTKR